MINNDLIGMRFGRLAVIGRGPVIKSRPFWVCQCDCGKEKAISYNSLQYGKSKSCGCLNREILRAQKKQRYSAEAKKCKDCHLVKSAKDFTTSKNTLDGLHSYCKECHGVRTKQWRDSVGKVYMADWRNKNRDLVRALSRGRKAVKRRSMPAWADRDAMHKVYLDAARLSIETGVTHHVDHVIPLNNPLVCGLHAHTNLQILPASENLRKRNKFSVIG